MVSILGAQRTILTKPINSYTLKMLNKGSHVAESNNVYLCIIYVINNKEMEFLKRFYVQVSWLHKSKVIRFYSQR